MWTDYPVRQLDGVFKWYYLVQTAFWLQQIFVINIEERRKDHVQMYTHHIVTSLLLMGSYGFHCSQVGNVILCLMDVVDILLPVCLTAIRSIFELSTDLLIIRPQKC
jgi:very-long-chain ceramide synthase